MSQPSEDKQRNTLRFDDNKYLLLLLPLSKFHNGFAIKRNVLINILLLLKVYSGDNELLSVEFAKVISRRMLSEREDSRQTKSPIGLII